MSPDRQWTKTTIVVVMFLLSYISLNLVGSIPGYRPFFRDVPKLWWWIENAVRPLIPVVVGLTLLDGFQPRVWLDRLGLNRPVAPALGLAVVLTLPMTLLPLAFGESPNPDLEFTRQLFGALIWPASEEICFRGFAFGQLYAYAGLGFWPAALATSGLFGVAHMTNAAMAGFDLAGQLINAAIVGGSALALAWIFMRWGKNLWLVIFLHALGNLSGALFMSGPVAVGQTLYLSLLGVTVVTGVTFTVLRDRWEWSRKVAEALGEPPK